MINIDYIQEKHLECSMCILRSNVKDLYVGKKLRKLKKEIIKEQTEIREKLKADGISIESNRELHEWINNNLGVECKRKSIDGIAIAKEKGVKNSENVQRLSDLMFARDRFICLCKEDPRGYISVSISDDERIDYNPPINKACRVYKPLNTLFEDDNMYRISYKGLLVWATMIYLELYDILGVANKSEKRIDETAYKLVIGRERTEYKEIVQFISDFYSVISEPEKHKDSTIAKYLESNSKVWKDYADNDKSKIYGSVNTLVKRCMLKAVNDINQINGMAVKYINYSNSEIVIKSLLLTKNEIAHKVSLLHRDVEMSKDYVLKPYVSKEV